MTDANELIVKDVTDDAVTLVTGQSVTDSLTSFFTDPEGDSLSISVVVNNETGKIPGLTFNDNGSVSGAPTADGVYNVTITATDGKGGEETHDVAFTVVTAPVITAIASSSGVVADGESIALSVTLTEAVDVTGTPELVFSAGGSTFTATYSSGDGSDTLLFTAKAIDVDSNSIVLQSITGLSLVKGQTSVQPLTDAVDQTVTGLVIDNSAPVLGAAQSIDVFENADVADVLFTAEASDVSSVTYSLTGDDADLFAISTDGKVTLKESKDFETKQDVGSDNVYNVNVRATDEQNQFAEQALAITVKNVNEAPEITSDATVSVAENTQAVGYQATSGDVDANDSRIYSLEGADKDLFDIDENTGVLTFVAATGADFEAKDSAAKDNDYKISVVVTDAGGLSDTQDLTVKVTDVNEAPEITSATSVEVAENTQAVGYTATSSDVDANDTRTYSLEGADKDLFAIDPNTGVLTFVATTGANYEANGSAASDNDYKITVVVEDAGKLTGSQALTVTVTDANELIVKDVTDDAVTLVTGQSVTDSLTSFFTDPEGDSLSISVDGAVSGLTFKDDGTIEGQPDTDGIYTVEITATDNNGGEQTHTVEFTVVTAPVITAIASSSGVVADGESIAISVTLTEAVDVTGTPELVFSAGGSTFTATYSSGDGSDTLLFTAKAIDVDSNSIVLQSITGLSLVKGQTSGQPLTDAVDQTVTGLVIDNSAPVLGAAQSIDVFENADVADVLFTAEASDVSSVTYSLTGDDADLFAISTDGKVTLKESKDFETKQDVGSDNVYNVNVRATDEQNQFAEQALAITVKNVNEAPVITDAGNEDSLVIDENSAAGAAVYTVAAADPESVGINYVLSGADAASFVVSSNGEVTLASGVTVDAESSKTGYSLTLEARDTADATLKDTVDLTVTVTDVNEAPEITSATSVEVAENTQAVGYTATSSDVDANDTRTYSLEGADKDLFAIDPNTGVLTFVATTGANYEANGSAASDNDYKITVVVEDAGKLTGSQALTVTVTDANELIVKDVTDDAVNLVTGQSVTDSLTSFFTDPEGDLLSISVVVNNETGEIPGLTFNDNGSVSGAPTADGVYNVTITATDGNGGEETHDVDFTVVSPPVISSKIDDVNNVSVVSKIILEASENLVKGSGSITIFNDGGDGYYGESVDNDLVIDVASSQVTIQDNLIIIDSDVALDFNNNYHIEIDAGAFVGAVSGLDSVVVDDASAINFSTVNPSATADAAASVEMTLSDSLEVAVESSLNWWGAEGNGTPDGNAATSRVDRDFSTGDNVLVFADLGSSAGIATDDFWINAPGLGDGDHIFIDNLGNNSQSRVLNDESLFTSDSQGVLLYTAPSQSGNATNGGQIDFGVNGFVLTTEQFDSLIQSTEPVIYYG
ncbi:putative Ig domain protein [Marinobacterium sp. xm-a-152]|nr:putative Ig domain protein [Marinobacterium sp. xm-a-152]